MGSRGRSIRLRIYFLVAIPLIAMIGLLAYVLGTSVDNAENLDRAPNLINATSLPAAEFVAYVQAERAAAVVYLFAPTTANLSAYDSAVATTNQNEPAFEAAMTSRATVSSETPAEAKAISTVVGGLAKLNLLRTGVKAQALSPLQALTSYSQGVAAEPALFLAEASSETNATANSQALGLIATVQAREALSQEDALLSGMLAGNRITQADRIAFNEAAGARAADLQYAQDILTPADLAVYNAAQNGSGSAQQALTGIEQAMAGGADIGQLPTSSGQWAPTASTLLQDYFNGGKAVAAAVLMIDHQTTRSAWIRVWVVGALALLGLLLTILATTFVARGIIRGLRGLERSALTLAEDQLPDVIARLRRGEDVDVASQAPPLRGGRDEIGRVGQAFALVQQTAIRGAVEEARLRRGLNDVFQSLARRSQSLLHRQLALLDQMERRATDPESLDDLFRLDHLTTRMRRHAEGLVILAGAPTARAWSSPVRMVDVMRGAIAEVEDYARVAVATRSQAALAGSAVADVIHLLAELIENATTLSPPYTSVRVSGDTVANGFAIEVEDRGLGMNTQRLAELNDRLSSPPEFNPSDSEQLGLFVVSQLAKRHGIKVTLKASPYGGVAAIVLIPRQLVVAEGDFRAELPGGEPAALSLAQAPQPVQVPQFATNGHNGAAAQLNGSGGSPVVGPPVFGEPVVDEEPDELPRRRDQATPANGAGAVPFSAAGTQPNGQAAPAFDVFTTQPQDTGERPDAGTAGVGPFPYAGPGSAPYPDEPAPFPGWTNRSPAPARPATPMKPVASASPAGKVPVPPWELSRQTGPLPVVPAGPRPGAADAAEQDEDITGLPRRVKQANLAPQLRANPPQRRVTMATGTTAGGPTPAEIRRTMSALQRGWQEGRTQPPTTAPPVTGEPPWETIAGHESPPDTEVLGSSDAT